MPSTARSALADAITLLKSKLAEVHELPGDEIHESLAGSTILSEEGVWLTGFDDDVQYGTVRPDNPTGTRATLILTVQSSRRHLDNILHGKPQSAMAIISSAVRTKIEAETQALTWVSHDPGMAVIYQGSRQFITEEALEMGFQLITVLMEGWEVQ